MFGILEEVTRRPGRDAAAVFFGGSGTRTDELETGKGEARKGGVKQDGATREAKTKVKNNSPTDIEKNARDMLRLAERNLARMLAELDATISELESRGDGAGARSKAVSADVR
ncbi:MAG TPA: hypothetical protein ENK80_06795, partial [Rhodobacterales bacterium]|nr:hypothetical protein [Rhodobacterales bacterium]